MYLVTFVVQVCSAVWTYSFVDDVKCYDSGGRNACFEDKRCSRSTIGSMPTDRSTTLRAPSRLPSLPSSTQTFHGGQDWAHLSNFVEDFSVTTNGLGTPEGAMEAAYKAVSLSSVHGFCF